MCKKGFEMNKELNCGGTAIPETTDGGNNEGNNGENGTGDDGTDSVSRFGQFMVMGLLLLIVK